MNRAIFLCVNKSPEAGLGHLRRAQILSNLFNEQSGAKCQLIAEDNFRIPCFLRIISAHINGANGQLIVFDLPSAQIIDSLEESTKAIVETQRLGIKIAIFDGVGQDSFSRHHGSLGANFLICPYVGAETISNATTKQLMGPKFFVFPAVNVTSANSKTLSPKILITMGGSDSTHITASLLEAMNSGDFVGKALEVVIGPLFDEQHTANIKMLAINHSAHVELHHAPLSLLDLMSQCQLAISASGLSKYELALMGTPTILISPTKILHDANVEFSKLGFSLDAGVASKRTIQYAAEQSVKLLNNSPLLISMSTRARKHFDGQGGKRVVQQLLEHSY